VADELKKLADLRDAGVLTAEAWHQERGTATAGRLVIHNHPNCPHAGTAHEAPTLATTGAPVRPLMLPLFGAGRPRLGQATLLIGIG
jgi:hypothetical protein